MVVDILRIVALVIIGVIASITDIGKGIIPNKLIIISLCVGMSFNIFSFIFIDRDKFFLFLINVAVIWILSLALYFSRIWAGGDSKLLCVMVLIYPVRFYWSIGNIRIHLLICIGIMFLYGLIYLIIESICLQINGRSQITFGQFAKSIIIGIWRYIRTIIYIAAINHIVVFFITPFIEVSNYIWMVLCIAISLIVNKFIIFNNKILLAIVGCFDVFMVIFTKQMAISTYWWSYLLVLLVIMLNIFIAQYNHKEIETDKVKKGMILSTVSSVNLQNSRVKGLPGVSNESLSSRLSEQEAESIRRWMSSKNGKETIVIVRKIPFAIFILCGMITYLIVGVFVL